MFESNPEPGLASILYSKGVYLTLLYSARGSRTASGLEQQQQQPANTSHKKHRARTHTQHTHTHTHTDTSTQTESVNNTQTPALQLCLLTAARPPQSSSEVKICYIMQPSIDFPPLAKGQLPAPKSELEPFVPWGDSYSLPDGVAELDTQTDAGREGNRKKRKGTQFEQKGKEKSKLWCHNVLSVTKKSSFLIYFFPPSA